MQKKTTQKDIAKALGVSFITVSRALNNSGYVSEETKDRIQKYIDEIGYVPDRGARALVKGEPTELALFSEEHPSYFWNEIEKGIRTASEQIGSFGYHVTYERIPSGNTQDYMTKVQEALERGIKAAALVHNSGYDMDRIYALLDEKNVPFITFNIDAPESGRTGYIGPDYKQGGRLAAEYIGKCLPAGCRVLLISSEDGETKLKDSNHLRESGFIETIIRDYPALILSTRHAGYFPGYMEKAFDALLAESDFSYDAVYVACTFPPNLPEIISTHNPDFPPLLVVHDTWPGFRDYLDDGRLSAVIYQNPVLQGYYAVKILEDLVEKTSRNRPEILELTNSLLLRENCDLPRNHNLLLGSWG